jgi:hypothetical protein
MKNLMLLVIAVVSLFSFSKSIFAQNDTVNGFPPKYMLINNYSDKTMLVKEYFGDNLSSSTTVEPAGGKYLLILLTGDTTVKIIISLPGVIEREWEWVYDDLIGNIEAIERDNWLTVWNMYAWIDTRTKERSYDLVFDSYNYKKSK